MPRWVWFAPLGVLVVAVGAWAFRLGWIVATISETDVIEAYTVRYLKTHGAAARATDCAGRPGENASVWIVVTCVSGAAQRVEYAVDRMGRLVQPAPETPHPQVPQT